MEEDNKEITTAFQLQLISQIIDINKYPFTKMIIDMNITKEAYDDVFLLLEKLNQQFEIQKEEGLLDYTSLLIHFAGMLQLPFEPTATIYALKKEGYFPQLMTTFIHILESESE
ncbi:DUF1878 family protein [Virgibacillus sp. MG-45]|uniref:DUF1878 family protein n=1 Tax=Virgibacillus sp. MG-45 TaxID=3102791 RepID=UPI002ED9828B